MIYQEYIDYMDELTAPPKDGDYDAHVKKVIQVAWDLLSGVVCPHCGTTEMLCGFNGVGCAVEEEDEDNQYEEDPEYEEKEDVNND